MAGARILNGTEIAAQIKQEVRAEAVRLASQGIRPGLAAVLVGSVAASEIYVRSKVKTCGELGLFSELITPPDTVTTEEMLALIETLNQREEIHGILIQLPLPPQVNSKLLLEAVSPEKDVDGFHPVNVGRLQTGQPALAPCTAAGVIEILKRSKLTMAGQNTVVLGCSDIVGKPTAILLLAGECDGHGMPLEDARSGIVHATRGHSRRRHRPSRVRNHGYGETGRYHRGRRNQPDYHARGI